MIGKNIKKFRIDKNITQDELAEKLCVTRQAVSNWERGKTEPDIETLQKLAETLEITIEELIYGERRKTKKLHIAFRIDPGQAAGQGISLGCVIAAVISFAKWQSVGWTILHGSLGWIYVIYYLIQYGWS